MTIIGVMPYVVMVATILVQVPLCSLFHDGEGSSDVDPLFASLKYFGSISIQLSVVSVPSQRSWCTILRSLLFMVIRLKFLVFPLLVFGVFCGGVSFPQGLLGILNSQHASTFQP